MTPNVEDLLDQFFTQYTEVSFEKGQALIMGEEEPDGVFYILSGVVKQVAVDANGDEVTLNLFRPPSFFPMTWAVAAVPNTYYYVAMNQVRAFRAPREAVVAFLKREPDVAYDLICRLSSGISGMLTHLEQLMRGTSSQKLINVLILLAARFGTRKNNGILISLPLTHPELAGIAGISRETATRILSELKQRGVLTYSRQRITILDPKALATAMEAD